MRSLAAIALAAFLTLVFAEEPASARLVIQSTFVVGLERHSGKRLFSSLRVDDPLQLVREPVDESDPNAVRVDWRGQTLGFVSADAARSVARQLDHGNRLRARVLRLSRHRDPDRRVEMEIYLPL
jgi:hypothetical protein